jgi:hypothetical protein
MAARPGGLGTGRVVQGLVGVRGSNVVLQGGSRGEQWKGCAECGRGAGSGPAASSTRVPTCLAPIPSCTHAEGRRGAGCGGGRGRQRSGRLAPRPSRATGVPRLLLPSALSGVRPPACPTPFEGGTPDQGRSPPATTTTPLTHPPALLERRAYLAFCSKVRERVVGAGSPKFGDEFDGVEGCQRPFLPETSERALHLPATLPGDHPLLLPGARSGGGGRGRGRQRPFLPGTF